MCACCVLYVKPHSVVSVLSELTLTKMSAIVAWTAKTDATTGAHHTVVERLLLSLDAVVDQQFAGVIAIGVALAAAATVCVVELTGVVVVFTTRCHYRRHRRLDFTTDHGVVESITQLAVHTSRFRGNRRTVVVVAAVGIGKLIEHQIVRLRQVLARSKGALVCRDRCFVSCAGSC